jgi:hypothetical protein
MTEGRDKNGKFSKGNGGGPGRPRRAIERDYLAALSDSVTLEDWREIVTRAVADAKSRDWIAKYVVGASPSPLIELAVKESRGVSVEAEISQQIKAQESSEKESARMQAMLGDLFGESTRT